MVASLGLDSLKTPDIIPGNAYTKSSDSWTHYQAYMEGIDYGACIDPGFTWSSETRAVGKLSRTMTGYRLPNWKDLVAEGASATTPFSGSMQRYFGSAINGSVVRLYDPNVPAKGTYRCWVKGMWGFPPLAGHLMSPSYDRADSKAIVSLRRAIKAQYAQWDSPTFLGELRDTVAMFRKPFQGLLKGVLRYNDNLTTITKTAVRIRKKAARIAYMTKGISDAYLEFAFGLKPTMLDAEDAAIALARFFKGDATSHTEVRGFGTDTDRLSVLYKNYSLFASYVMFDLNLTYTGSYLVVYRAGLERRLNGPEGSLGRLRELVGFDLNQFVPTIWNCLPWSFLADYLYNIGDVLEADYVDTSSVRWVNRSVVQESTRAAQLNFVAGYAKSVIGPAFISDSGNSGVSTGVHRSVARSALGNVPYPQVIRKIDFPSQLSDGKTANLAALAISAALGLARDMPRIARRGS